MKGRYCVLEIMEFLNAYLLSPGSVIVALVTVIFLVHQSWQRFSRPKRTFQNSNNIPKTHEPTRLTVSKEPEVTEGWWSGRDIFELERRAIFSKSWLYIAHVAHFSKAGSYQSFEIAGFPIFLIRGKDNKIRAFHNVCRHRAYTITRKETGTSTVLGCRYHGWSYDTTGQLVKAPQFDGIPGFDKSENSLFEIHTHTTKQGWIFVNLDAGEPTCFPESTVSDLDRFARTVGLVSESKWLAGQTLTGTFNWKFGASAHYYTDVTFHYEDIVSAAAPPSLATKIMKMFMPCSPRATCHLFPGSLIYSFAAFPLWIALSFVPASESTTQLRYDLFSLSSKTGVIKEELAAAVAGSAHTLLQRVETDFQTVTTDSIDISPQSRQILTQLQEHARLEKKSGGQILPAMRQPKGSSLFQQAEQLCKEIECAGTGPESSAGVRPLDW